MLKLLKYVNDRIDEVMEGIYATDEILRDDSADPDAFREADEAQMKLNGQLEELQKMKDEMMKRLDLK